MFLESFNQAVSFEGIHLTLKREDNIHPYISGNKFRKLKYNLLKAKELNHHTLLTFGGAFSNHLLATAYAGKLYNFKTIGVVRGDEISRKLILENPTLSKCQSFGMTFHFVSREDYRNKTSPNFLEELQQKFGNFYAIPEGGSNDLALKGCQEILTAEDDVYDVIACAVGTGTTMAGLINKSVKNQLILGFPALKGNFLEKDIRIFANKRSQWDLISDYHFGGYAKVTEDYINWLNYFYLETNLMLDPIYTGKMMFGVIDMVKKNKINNTAKILCIHTGGLQGVVGMNKMLNEKNRRQLVYEKDINFM